MATAGGWWRRLGFYERWLILAPLIGALSGVFAAGFYYFMGAFSGLLAWALGYLDSPGLVFDASTLFIGAGGASWLTPLVVAAGAGAGGLLVYKVAPEAEGHGTNAAIEAYHRRAGIVRPAVPPVKALASAVTIGSGGSGGVEGPSVQMGSGLGSWLSGLLGLSPQDRRVALVAGMAGALSALFRSPLGAPFFAVEVLYKRDLEAPAFIPAFIASIASYAVTAPLLGYGGLMPRLDVDPASLYTPGSLAAYVLLGCFLAPFAVLYVRAFNGARRLFDSLQARGLPAPLKPVLGGLAAGVLGVAVPHVLGSGREATALAIEYMAEGGGPFSLPWLPLWASLALIAVAKIAAVSLSIGSGGSGGVFAPGIMAGALLGGSFGVLAGSAVSPLPPEAFSYIGMAAFFGAAAKVPLAVSVMAAEMGGNYHLIAPTLIAGFIARQLAGEESIYESQLPRRLEPGVVGASILLAALRASGVRDRLTLMELADADYPTVPPEAPLAHAVDLMLAERRRLVIVVGDDGRPVGVLDAEDLEDLIEEVGRRPGLPVGRAPLRRPPALLHTASIEEALDSMVKSGLDYVLVVGPDGSYRGVVTVEEVDAALAHLYLESPSRG